MARPVSIVPINFPLIRHGAKERGVLFRDLAEQIGVRDSHFSEMLSGLRPLNDERLAKLSDVLGVPHNYFRTSLGRLVIQKAEADLTDFALTEARHDVRV